MKCLFISVTFYEKCVKMTKSSEQHSFFIIFFIPKSLSKYYSFKVNSCTYLPLFHTLLLLRYHENGLFQKTDNSLISMRHKLLGILSG